MTLSIENTAKTTDHSQPETIHEDGYADGYYFDKSRHLLDGIHDTRVGLGAYAVSEAIHHSIHNADGETRHQLGFEKSTKMMLDDAREQLVSLATSGSDESDMISRIKGKVFKRKLKQPTHKDPFNNFLNEHSNSQALNQILGVDSSENVDYVTLLTKKNAEGEYKIDDKKLLNFLEWHNHELVKLQEKYDSEKQKKHFDKKLIKAIADGWIPHWVQEWAPDRLYNTEVVVDDGFRTKFSERQSVANALHVNEIENEIVISPSEIKKSEQTMTHEFLHVIDGIEWNGDVSNQGLMKLFNEDAHAARTALNEAVTEHLASSMYGGLSIDQIDPSERKRLKQTRVYVEERKLLNVLANMGKNKIDIRTFIKAYFDDGMRIDNNGLTPTESLKNEIEKAFPGQNVLENLSNCKDSNEIYEYSKKLRGFNYGKWKRTKAELKTAVADLALGTTVGLAIVSPLGFVANHIVENGRSNEDTQLVEPQLGVQNTEAEPDNYSVIYNSGNNENNELITVDINKQLTKQTQQSSTNEVTGKK